jgi:hypothetical protein
LFVKILCVSDCGGAAQEVIIHGTITRYRVQRGEVALLWQDNQPLVNDVPG